MSAKILGRRDVLRFALAAKVLANLKLSAAEIDARTAWYRRAKFGMFIHWGPYSLASVEASWPIMTPKAGGISEADYRGLARRFNPTRFDPAAFVDLARSAGQKYMVFTTKHHDGFCMFDSSYTKYKITDTPYEKDIVAALSRACLADEMPLGFYYSPPDMTHPCYRDTSKLAAENWRGEPTRPEWPVYLDYMRLQLTELLTRYGPAALIWFDGLDQQQKYDGQRFIKLIGDLQPATLVNNRIGTEGDFETPEQFIPKAIPTKGTRINSPDAKAASELKQGVPAPEDFRLWETCMTINDTWAYNKNDHNFKSSQFLIQSLVEVASRGGNFLLNVGPQPDGVIQPEFQVRLRDIGKWLALNGESIYDTTYGPVQGASAIRTTARGRSIYVHILNWPAARSVEVPGLNAKVEDAHFLAGSAPLQYRQSESGLVIDVPTQAPDPNVSVIALRVAG